MNCNCAREKAPAIPIHVARKKGWCHFGCNNSRFTTRLSSNPVGTQGRCRDGKPSMIGSYFCRLEHSQKRSRLSYCRHLSSFSLLRVAFDSPCMWRSYWHACAAATAWSQNGETPLHLAAQQESSEAARVLLEYGGAQVQVRVGYCIHPTSSRTPLLAAVALQRFCICISTSFAKFHSVRAEPSLPPLLPTMSRTRLPASPLKLTQ